MRNLIQRNPLPRVTMHGQRVHGTERITFSSLGRSTTYTIEQRGRLCVAYTLDAMLYLIATTRRELITRMQADLILATS